MRTAIAALLLLPTLAVAQSRPTTGVAPRPAVECAPRAGLPNVVAKVRASATVRIAYLGGSITAAKGWRVLSREWLAAQYPHARFEEIHAAIPGTGAEFGAARLQHDVLDHKPDLIFVEFAVNGAGDRPERMIESMEGIVRQARAANPDVDLCFVYTIQQSMLPDLAAGRVTPLEERMETIADRYGIPTINFGVEVARQVAAGTLVFKGDAAGPGVFTTDGVHPLIETGHPIYLGAIARSWPAIVAASSSPKRELPSPLAPTSWSRVRFLAPDAVERVGQWSAIAADDRAASTSRDFNDDRPLWRSTKAGDALTFTFTGTAFGMHGVKGPDVARARVTVDDREPIIATFFDVTCIPGRYKTKPWFYPDALPPGSHRVRVEAIEEPNKAARIGASKPAFKDDPIYAEQRLYLRGIYVIGEP